MTGRPHHEYPLLVDMFRRYHQDWDLEGLHADAVIEHVLERGPTSPAALLAELDRLRAQIQPFDDQSAQMFMYRELGCEYFPYAPEKSPDEWLAHLRQLAREASR